MFLLTFKKLHKNCTFALNSKFLVNTKNLSKKNREFGSRRVLIGEPIKKYPNQGINKLTQNPERFSLSGFWRFSLVCRTFTEFTFKKLSPLCFFKKINFSTWVCFALQKLVANSLTLCLARPTGLLKKKFSGPKTPF